LSERSHTTFELAGRVGTLILNRPDLRNALTDAAMLEEILEAIATAEASAGVLVVTGSGTAFSSGGNIKDMRDRVGLFAGTPEEMVEGYRDTVQRLTRAMASTDLVTIAAVNGPAVGAGFDLALGCDLRIGSTHASFAHTFVDLGIIPGDGGAWLLPRVVGWQRAAELAFTARRVDATEALAAGILLEVVSPTELMARAMDLATQIAAKPAHSVRLTKRLLRHARQMDLEGFLDLSAAFQAIAHHTEAHLDAVKKFSTKSR
jgi:enoyl-CoA hydratase/carnithine racemase